MTAGWIEYVVVFIFGTAIGSFLNVVIYRVPLGKSIVRPGSSCPACNRPIRFYENIPILSYILLRGRCAGCGRRISLRYPAVEAGMGLIAVILFNRFGLSWDLLFYSAFGAVLLALSVIDIICFRLPNKIVLTGAIIAIVLTLLVRRDHLIMMIIGGLTGLGMLWIMGLIGRLLFRKDTLGMGDIKLAGMMGLYLGPYRTGGMFIIGVFIGAIAGVTMIALGGKKLGHLIPFGPYLALGGMIALLWGDILWHWYLSMLLP